MNIRKSIQLYLINKYTTIFEVMWIVQLKYILIL